MEIVNEMIERIRMEWGAINPHQLCRPVFNSEFGYSFSCFFSVADYKEDKKIVFGIANLSSNKFNVITLSSIGNVEIPKHLCKLVKELFPNSTFAVYREIIFEILDEFVVPVFNKYDAGFPPGFQLLDVSKTIIEDEGVNTQISLSIGLHDMKFNYQMVRIIEDYLRNDEAI